LIYDNVFQAGRTADPPPAISAPPRSFLARIIDKVKTWTALRNFTAANPSIGFSRNLFPVEAERIFAATASAIENGDKAALRNLVTEQYYSALKKQLPEKKRGTEKVAIATAGSTIVQARRVTLTRCPA
jgi:predicted lipid-binding transport protein (Tim44 family)